MVRTRRFAPVFALVAAAFLAAACGGGATTRPGSNEPAGSQSPMEALIAGARAEGSLTTIALLHGWCGYGDLISNFKTKYEIAISELNPEGGSKDEIDAINQSKAGGPSAPDVIDVGVKYGPPSVSGGILQPYKVTSWETIPGSAKDAHGNWYGGYYGVVSFEVNTALVKEVPSDWSDLLKPAYKKSIALSGDPTVSGNALSQAAFAVWSASLANGGSLDDAQPGLAFFKQLNAAGNLVPVVGTTATVASGQTPIRITWTYSALADRDYLRGAPPITVVVPSRGRLGGTAAQAISAFAPHPNAAKLWEEYLYSDQGQLTWLKNYCSPIRYEDLKSRGIIPPEISARVPDTSGTMLPTVDQIEKAGNLIVKGWAKTVGVAVK
jgi:putative spermidine/putrescine transport system substrate-binding protein